MTLQQLNALLKSLTVEEKIGQLCRGNPEMFGKDGTATGQYELDWVTDEFVRNLGSVLNIKNTAIIRKI